MMLARRSQSTSKSLGRPLTRRFWLACLQRWTQELPGWCWISLAKFVNALMANKSY